MNQKQKSLLIVKTILLSCQKNNTNIPDILSHLIQKINSCLELANPDVLLSLQEKALFNKLAEDERSKGRII